MAQKKQSNLIPEEIYMREDEISLKELLLTLIREKKTIFLCTLIVLLAVTVVSLLIPHMNFGTKGTLQTAVQLYFPGIKEGNTPSGQKYDVNEIKSVEVLEKAIAYAALQNRNISLSRLRANIQFEALLPEDVAIVLNQLENIKDENIKLERLQTLQINPDAYIITLNVANDLGISVEEGRRLLDALARAYKDWLIQRYAVIPELSNVFFPPLNLEEYDYVHATDVLDKQLEDMENYVSRMINLAGTKSVTRQPVREMQEVRSILSSIRTVDIEGLYTKISALYITKNPQKAEAIYRQLAESRMNAAAQSAEEATSLREIIASFHGTEQTLIFGEINENILTLQNESGQYNEFVTQYTEAKSREASSRAQAEYYIKQAERFAGRGTDITVPEDVAKEIMESISQIKEKLIYWVDVINKAEDIYLSDVVYEQYAEQMIPSKEYKEASSINLLMNMAIGLAAGLFMGILIVLLKEFLKDED